MTYNNGSNTFLPPSPVVPMFLRIVAITQSKPAIITITGQIPDNIYIVGQMVYLSIPFTYGMFQANGLSVQLIGINVNQFTVNLDSTQFDPFVVPTPSHFTEAPATLSPAGSRNTFNVTSLPFHSLGNVGN